MVREHIQDSMTRMTDTELIQGPDGDKIQVTIRRDRRLKKSARWVRESRGHIVLRVPPHLRQTQVKKLLTDVADQLSKQRIRADRLTDQDLNERARRINKTHFNGEIEWASIRWVGNMQKRLGSCTNGGPTDGHIRISDRIRNWPDWVIDYIIAHELAHRTHPNHSHEFWEYLEANYPLTERARGFIDGYAYAQAYEQDNDPLTED